MKALLLAAGRGTRLGPLTANQPKPMIPIGGVPMIERIMGRIAAQTPIREFVLITGYKADVLEGYFGDGAKWGVEVEYAFDGPKLLGTGGALIAALPRLGDAFYVLYGDSYLPVDYRAVGDFFLHSGRLGLMTVYENHGRYDTSNVEFTAGDIRNYDKKIRTPAMRHIDYGLGVFRAAAFEGFPRDAVVDLATVQTQLCQRHQLAGYEMKQRFYEIGSHEGLNELDALLRNQRANG